MRKSKFTEEQIVVHDGTAGGRTFRTLNVVDRFTRETRGPGSRSERGALLDDVFLYVELFDFQM